mmetsp:Transcript_4700/g.11581  ORF Transcript_4700/g.11581 Transcript_4700/m.11581 type:complete len:148 (-) Transcript_4700:155-598(-)
MVKAPAAKWAQRADKILLTIDVPDLDPAQTKVEIKEDSFSFTSGDFELKFEFFGQVDHEAAKWKVGARDVDFVIPRKEAGEYWDKLNKGTKLHTVKTDFNRWVDEDEAKEAAEIDMSGYGDGFNLGNHDGPDSDDDDDEDEIPALDA